MKPLHLARVFLAECQENPSLIVPNFGLCQWFGIVPYLEKSDSIVMLKGVVDDSWHSLIASSGYHDFCYKNFGRYIAHNPDSNNVIDDNVIKTIRLLEKAYGKDLCPELNVWREDFFSSYYEVCCVVRGV